MKHLSKYVKEALRINKTYSHSKGYLVKNNDELKSIIKERAKLDDRYHLTNKNIDLSDLDVSRITDMSNLFEFWEFETINVSNWDVSNVKNMRMMFYGCQYLKDIIGIDKWDMSNVERMDNMFASCAKLDISDKLNKSKTWIIDPTKRNCSGMFSNTETKFNFTYIEESLKINKNYQHENTEIIDDLIKYLYLDVLNDLEYCKNRWRGDDKIISDKDMSDIRGQMNDVIDMWKLSDYDPRKIEYRTLRGEKKTLSKEIAKRYGTISTVLSLPMKAEQLYKNNAIELMHVDFHGQLMFIKKGPYGGIYYAIFKDV